MSDTFVPSFSFSVKEELASLDYSKEEGRALLSGFIKSNGSFRLSNGKETLDLSTESSKVAMLLYKLVAMIYGIQGHFAYTRGVGSRKAIRYHCLIPSCDVVLKDVEVDFFNSKVPSFVSENKDSSAAYLQGVFLAVGYVSDPRNKNYHLEFPFSDKSYATWISHLINKAVDGNFESKIVERRKQSVVYIKRSEKISEFLAYLQASNSCLDFENARVDRDFANIGNRLRNLDGANQRKKEAASETQLREILFLKERGVLQSVRNIKTILLCDLRIANPDASMESLAEMLSEEMGMSISKSNINHLFRSIHELYLLEKDK